MLLSSSLAVYSVAPATADSTEHTARNLRPSGSNNNAILRGTEGGERDLRNRNDRNTKNFS